jgi:valyl-tRNA synthetase
MVRWYEKKKPKSVDSTLHQATKALSKSVKVVRGLLVANYVRKLKALEGSSEIKKAKESHDCTDNIASHLKKIEDLKQLNHADVAENIVIKKLFPVARKDVTAGETDGSDGNDAVNSLIVGHPTIKEAISTWTVSIKAAVRDEAIAKRDAELAELKKKKAEEREKEGVHVKRGFDGVSMLPLPIHWELC